MQGHDVQQGLGSRDIHFAEQLGLDVGPADFDQAREMNHSGDAVAADRIPQGGGVANIALDQRPPAHSLAKAGAQVVKGNRHVPGLAQGRDGIKGYIYALGPSHLG